MILKNQEKYHSTIEQRVKAIPRNDKKEFFSVLIFWNPEVFLENGLTGFTVEEPRSIPPKGWFPLSGKYQDIEAAFCGRT